MKKDFEETKKIVNETGNVTVSENVIASIVENTVLEIEGVKAIAGDEPANKVLEFISNKTNIKEKGIKVDIKNNSELVIEISVVLKYGNNVIDIAKVIQEKTKEVVENVVGMHVLDVDVYIDQISAE